MNGLAPLRHRTRGVIAALRDRGSLTSRAASSAVWRFGGFGVAQALRLGGNLVMTRLVAPEAFGVMAVVLVLHAGVTTIGDVGIDRAVIRGVRGGEAGFLRTAWTMRVLQFLAMAAFVALAGVGLAYAQTRFDFGETIYAHAALPALIVVSALALVLRGLQSMNVADAERRLVVARVAVMEILTRGASVACMLAYALLVSADAWALVVGTIVGTSVGTVFSHVAMPGVAMRFHWVRDEAREIWVFGRWMIGASIFGFLAGKGDRMLLSAVLGAEGFSLYTIARIWIDALSDAIGKSLPRVMTASFSEVIRERPQRLLAVFTKTRMLLTALMFTMFLAVFVSSEYVFGILYSVEYQAVGALVALLSPILLTRSFLSYGSLLIAAGRGRDIALASALRALGLVAIGAAGYAAASANGAILGTLLGPLAVAPFFIQRGVRIVGIGATREALHLLLIVVTSVAVFLAQRDALAAL